MKKFKFTLATLLKIKEANEKQKQQEFAEAQRLLRAAQDELAALESEFAQTREQYNESLKIGLDVIDMQFFSQYFVYLRERIQLAHVKIRQAEAERDRRQRALVEAMTEVKALVKLKEAQLTAYQQELKQEQEKEIGDFVSFQVISK